MVEVMVFMLSGYRQGASTASAIPGLADPGSAAGLTRNGSES